MNLISKVFAQARDGGWNIFGTMPRSGQDFDFPSTVNAIISIMLMAAGAIAAIYLIYSGILYLTAAGNPDAAKKGQQGIINAVIGIVVIVLVYVIMNAVASITTDIAPR